MFNIFLTALMSQAVLIFAGFAILQIVSRRRLFILEEWPFAWGAGLAFLYILGGILVRFHFLKGIWHFIILAFALLLAFLFPWIRKRRLVCSQSPAAFKLNLKWYEWLIMALILFKVGLVASIQMNNPVIDSDAAHPALWVGLAKVIYAAGTLAPGVKHSAYYCPSLLPVWSTVFLPRWHDNFIGLPWLMTYLAIPGVVFVTVRRITTNRFMALVGAYFFSALPLAVVHVIRPGYSDLILSYFFLLGISVLAHPFSGTAFTNRPVALAVAGVSFLGCLLTKHEGLVWIFWMGLAGGSWWACRQGLVHWPKMIGGLLACVLIALTIRWMFSDFILANVPMDGRFQQLLMNQYNPMAVKKFFVTIFWRGSFNLVWWFAVLISVLLWVRRTNILAKVFALYVFFLLSGVFYLACFSANVEYTLQETNIGRVLIQISGVLLPLLCLFYKEIYADCAKNNPIRPEK